MQSSVFLLRTLGVMLVAMMLLFITSLAPFSMPLMILLFTVMVLTSGFLLYYFTWSVRLFLKKDPKAPLKSVDRTTGLFIGVVLNAIILYIMFVQMFSIIYYVSSVLWGD